MKYFVSVSDKNGTLYHEFYKGKWDQKTFWKEDSLLLRDCYVLPHLADVLARVNPRYNYYGATEISPAQWEQAKQIVFSGHNTEVRQICEELDPWAVKVFKEYGCLTILGI